MQELQGLCMQLSINHYSWNDIRRSNFMLNMAVRLHSFLQTLHLQTLLIKKIMLLSQPKVPILRAQFVSLRCGCAPLPRFFFESSNGFANWFANWPKNCQIWFFGNLRCDCCPKNWNNWGAKKFFGRFASAPQNKKILSTPLQAKLYIYALPP